MNNTIVLVKRWACAWVLKLYRRLLANAAALIIYTNGSVPHSPSLGTVNSSDKTGCHILVFALSLEDREALVAAVAGGEVIGIVVVDAVNEVRYSSNLFTTTMDSNKSNILVAGGNTDSVQHGSVGFPKHSLFRGIL